MKATPVFPKWYFHKENAFQKEDLDFFESIVSDQTTERKRKVSLHQGQQEDIVSPKDWPREIHNKLLKYINDVGAFYTPEMPTYRIQPIWSNVFDDGGYNVPHTHQGSWLSGIIYVKDCNELNTIFLTERTVVTPNKAFQNNIFSPAVKDGDLVLFESDLWHWVPPTNKGRITIAFNVQINRYSPNQTILVPEIKIDI